jgi:hypothetical protein
MVEKFTKKLSEQLDRGNLGWLKRSFLLIDSMVKFHLLAEPNILFETLNPTNVFYLHYFYANNPSEDFRLESTPFKQIKMEAILSFLEENLSQFIVIYAF